MNLSQENCLLEKHRENLYYDLFGYRPLLVAGDDNLQCFVKLLRSRW